MRVDRKKYAKINNEQATYWQRVNCPQSLKREDIEAAICRETTEVLMMFSPKALLLHTANLLCYVLYRLH